MDNYELITRNVEEVVTETEVRAIADDPVDKRVYVGYEPSGVLHLGHLLTANKLINLQKVGMDVIILLADVHAYLNGKGTFEEIEMIAEQMREQFLAYGLDEDRTEFRYGSSFQFEKDYILDLEKLMAKTTLNRAQRAMAELQSGETVKVSHVIYPLMQALDIEYLDLDLAIGGMDQRKVHMLHREQIPDLGYEKRPVIHTPILADLETGAGKMSASTGVTISLEDMPEDIEEKVSKAYCPPTRNPEPADGNQRRENPVLELYQYHIFPRFETVTVERPEKYGGDHTYEDYVSLAQDLENGVLHPEDAKETLAMYLNHLIAPAREKFQE